MWRSVRLTLRDYTLTSIARKLHLNGSSCNQLWAHFFIFCFSQKMPQSWDWVPIVGSSCNNGLVLSVSSCASPGHLNIKHHNLEGSFVRKSFSVMLDVSPMYIVFSYSHDSHAKHACRITAKSANAVCSQLIIQKVGPSAVNWSSVGRSVGQIGRSVGPSVGRSISNPSVNFSNQNDRVINHWPTYRSCDGPTDRPSN